MRDAARRALRLVDARLGAHGIAYALGGSGLLWALGLTEDVGDLDLTVDPAEEEALLRATADWREAHTREGTELWASAWFSRLVVAGVAVDVIGGMAFRHARGVAVLPLRTAGTVEVDGASIPCADPAEWWAVYRAYKPRKALLLERVVTPEQRAAVSAELGLVG